MRIRDRHQTPDSVRDNAKRIARRPEGDQTIRSICANTRPRGPRIECPACGCHVASVMDGALEVCYRRPNHDGPCFDWPDA